MHEHHCAKRMNPWAIIIWALIWLVIGFYSESASAARKHSEQWYQEAWCTEGVMEYMLPDRTRVDCLTATHAVEIDFSDKWYQGITQSLWYAANTGRRAGVLLIVEDESDLRYLLRAKRLVDHYGLPVDVWIVRSAD